MPSVLNAARIEKGAMILRISMLSAAFAAIAMVTPAQATAVDDPDEAAAEAAADLEEAVRLGYLEHVQIGNLALELKGKLDTGADTSSIHARDVEVYKRGKRDNWVRFRIVGRGGRSIRYDQNVIRFVQIKTKVGGTIRRPVIRMPLCVGGVSGRAEINLANRAEFEYDVLVGREFLANRVIVDPGQTFTSKTGCGKEADE